MSKIYRYPGSTPFTEEYAGLFFGRDEDIDNLATLVSVEKLVVLYGKSGLGKSSLLSAGVLPKLEKEHKYLVIPVRFGSATEDTSYHPLDIVEEQLAGYAPEASFVRKIEPENLTLWELIKDIELAHRDRSTILLVFDQFEELFTYREGVAAFANALSELTYNRMPKVFSRALRLTSERNPEFLSGEQWEFLQRPINLRVLVSIRSDKMSLLDSISSHIPNILHDCYELKPLSRSQAESAIVEPARREGEFLSSPFTYEPAALEKILDFLTQNGSKAIETFQLQILCQWVEENIVIADDDVYVQVKDIGDLEAVYQNYYDASIRKLGDEKDERLVRVFIENGLIFEEEERRVRLFEGQIQSRFGISKDLLSRLVDTHIIRSEPHVSGGYMYELSHDTLVAPILKAKARRMRQEAKRRRKKKTVRALAVFGVPLLIGAVSLATSWYAHRGEVDLAGLPPTARLVTRYQAESDDPEIATATIQQGVAKNSLTVYGKREGSTAIKIRAGKEVLGEIQVYVAQPVVTTDSIYMNNDWVEERHVEITNPERAARLVLKQYSDELRDTGTAITVELKVPFVYTRDELGNIKKELSKSELRNQNDKLPRTEFNKAALAAAAGFEDVFQLPVDVTGLVMVPVAITFRPTKASGPDSAVIPSRLELSVSDVYETTFQGYREARFAHLGGTPPVDLASLAERGAIMVLETKTGLANPSVDLRDLSSLKMENLPPLNRITAAAMDTAAGAAPQVAALSAESQLFLMPREDEVTAAIYEDVPGDSKRGALVAQQVRPAPDGQSKIVASTYEIQINGAPYAITSLDDENTVRIDVGLDGSIDSMLLLDRGRHAYASNTAWAGKPLSLESSGRIQIVESKRFWYKGITESTDGRAIMPFDLEFVADTWDYWVPYSDTTRGPNGGSSLVSVVSAFDGATVRLDFNHDGSSDSVFPLQRGQAITIQSREGTHIRSTRPLSVSYRYQISDWETYEDGWLMFLIPPVGHLGTDYWVPSTVTKLVVLAVEDSSKVKIDGQPYTLQRGGVQQIKITDPPGDSSRAVHVSADKKVMVVAINFDEDRHGATYAYAALPAQDTVYFVSAENPHHYPEADSHSRVEVITTEDSTTVQCGADKQTLPEAGTVKTCLAKGDDVVRSDKPVFAVYISEIAGADAYTGVPRRYTYAHPLLPSSMAGTRYLLAGYAPSSVEGYASPVGVAVLSDAGGATIGSLELEGQRIVDAEFSSGNRPILLTQRDDGRYDLRGMDGPKLEKLDLGHPRPSADTAALATLSPKGRYIFASNSKGGATLLALRGSRIDTIGAIRDTIPIQRVDFSADGRLILTSDSAGRAALWHLKCLREPNCQPVKTFPDPGVERPAGQPLPLALLTPDGRYVVALDGAGSARVWDLNFELPKERRLSLDQMLIILNVPFLAFLLVLMALSPVAFFYELITAESWLSQLRKRADDPSRQKGWKTRVARWLS